MSFTFAPSIIDLRVFFSISDLSSCQTSVHTTVWVIYKKFSINLKTNSKNIDSYHIECLKCRNGTNLFLSVSQFSVLKNIKKFMYCPSI